MNKPVTPCLFIGGPFHQEMRDTDQEEVISTGTGDYKREEFGFEGHEFETVYVWEGMLISEALDFAIIAMRASN